MHSIPLKTAQTEDNFSHRRVSLALIIDVLRVSREIFYFINLLKKQSQADQTALSTSLNEVGDVVKDMFDKLTSGFFPTGCCQKLDLLSQRLYFQLEVVLGSEHAQSLVNKLKQTHRVEVLHREFSTGVIDPRELILLDEAANHFSATSKMLQA
jgi:hypothetical protein